MVSTPTTRNRLNKQGTGDSTNTWGTVLNGQVFDMIDEALDGYVAVTVSGNVTLTSTNYVTDQARMRQLWLSGDGGYTVTIPGVQKFYLVRNACTAAVTFTAGGVTCSVPASQSRLVFTNGTDCYVSDDGASLAYVNATFLPLAGGTLTGNLVLTGDAASALHAVPLQQLQAAVLSAAAGNLPALTGNTLKFLRVNAGETSVEWAAATLAALGASANGVSLVSAADYAAMRALLDLEAGTDFYSIAAAAAAFQPLDADLTALAAISGVQGDIIYRDASSWVRLGAGTAGQFLQTRGAGANPVWASPEGGGMTTKPLQLNKTLATSASMADGATNVATGATFWTNVGNNGSAVDTDWTASAWKTILSVAGGGELMSAIGPTLASSTHTVEMEITVDSGTPVTFTFTATTSAQRAIWGGAALQSSAVNPSTAFDLISQNSTEQVASNVGGFSVYPVAPYTARRLNLTRLRFEASLLVRMRTSQNITATANQERQAGVTWIAD